MWRFLYTIFCQGVASSGWWILVLCVWKFLAQRSMNSHAGWLMRGCDFWKPQHEWHGRNLSGPACIFLHFHIFHVRVCQWGWYMICGGSPTFWVTSGYALLSYALTQVLVWAHFTDAGRLKLAIVAKDRLGHQPPSTCGKKMIGICGPLVIGLVSMVGITLSQYCQ